jgi:hypothetical protein
MKKLTLVTLLTLATTMLSSACICKLMTLKELRKKEFLRSSIILIGDISHKDNSYQVKLVELLKGEIRDSLFTVYIRSSCAIPPTEGRWIIYVNSIPKIGVELFSCGLSRSFLSPIVYVKEYLIEDGEKSLRFAKRDLEKEIKMLRQRFKQANN